MSEFHTNDSGECLIIPEDEQSAAVELSENILKYSLDDAQDWIGEQGLATHVRLTHEDGFVLLVSQDIHSQQTRMRYILDLKTGGFMVIRGTLTDLGHADVPAFDLDFMNESVETTGSLGQYLGTEQDWRDFLDVLRDGKTAMDHLHAYYEQVGRTALRSIDDSDTSDPL